MGYIYGKCARQLHYANKFGYNGFTKHDKEIMQAGKDIHVAVQQDMIIRYPDYDFHDEVKRQFTIQIDNQPFVIGAKADLIAEMHPNLRYNHQRLLIEIKYLYSRSAYYQTLINKLVFPDTLVFCYQYGNLTNPKFVKNILIPLKADIQMAKVYAGRIITSLYYMPPRFPNAYYSHPVCAKCLHRDVCYTDKLDMSNNVITDMDGWIAFKNLSQPFIEQIVNQTANLI